MASTDDFAGLSTGLDGPLNHIAVVTTNDATDLAHESRAIYIGVAGDLKIITAGGETVTILSGVLAVGVPHPIRATRIFATGTTATNIVVGW
jgi:hypothetical protein